MSTKGNDPPPHVSPSALKSFGDCGKRHQLQRILGLAESPAWYSIAGTAIHKGSEILDLQRFEREGR